MLQRALTCLLLAVAVPAAGQTSAEDQARRLLDDGRSYWEQGKPKQALDNFSTIVSGFAATSLVDDALLEIGRYHADVEQDVARAREAYEQVTKRFPQSDGAPAAYYQLGWLALRSARSAQELDDALAHFDRVVRLHARSRWVAPALYASSVVHRRAGRMPEAAAAGRRVTFEYPASEVAAAAGFEAAQALALSGDAQAAMETFQQVRNVYPGSPLAAVALDRITALYRLHSTPRPTFAADRTSSPGAGEILKDVRAIAVDPSGALWIASEKTGTVVPFATDASAAATAAIAAPDLRALSIGPAGEIVATSKLTVRVGPRDVRGFTVAGQPLDKLTAAVLLPGGAILVADERQKKVFRCDAAGCRPWLADAREREVPRMVLDAEGRVVLIDRETRTVQVYDRAGALLRTVGPRGAGYDFRKPVDVAVDAFGNLYVADDEVGVFVLSATGTYMATLGGEDVRRPKAVAVDAAGGVLVYDDKAEKVVRFR